MTGCASSEDNQYGWNAERRGERHGVVLLGRDDKGVTESVVVKDNWSVIGGPVSETRPLSTLDVPLHVSSTSVMEPQDPFGDEKELTSYPWFAWMTPMRLSRRGITREVN